MAPDKASEHSKSTFSFNHHSFYHYPMNGTVAVIFFNEPIIIGGLATQGGCAW